MMSYKLPVVASDGFGIRNMFENDKNAIVANISDRNKPEVYVLNLAKSIKKLLSSNNYRQRIGEGGYQYIKEKHLEEVMRNKYLDLFE